MLKCVIESIINDIYSNVGKDKQGEEKTYTSIEIKNYDSKSAFDRYYRLNIDSTLADAIDLVAKKSQFVGKKCRLDCQMSQYQGTFNLFVFGVSLV